MSTLIDPVNPINNPTNKTKEKPKIEFNPDGTIKVQSKSDVPVAEQPHHNQLTASINPNLSTNLSTKAIVSTSTKSNDSTKSNEVKVPTLKGMETGGTSEPVLRPHNTNKGKDSGTGRTVEALVGSRLGHALPSKAGGLTADGLNPDFRFDDRKVVAGQYVPEKIDIPNYSHQKGRLLSEISLVLKESGADSQQQLKSLEKINLILSKYLES